MDWRDYCDQDQDCYKHGTGWSFIWAWNMAWCIVMGLNFIVLTVGSCYWWPRFIGTICLYLLSSCHMAGWIFMIIGVTNPYARMCRYNKATSSYAEEYKWYWNRMTYENDYFLMTYFAIALSSLWCIQVCCCCIPCYRTPISEVGEQIEPVTVKT